MLAIVVGIDNSPIIRIRFYTDIRIGFSVEYFIIRVYITYIIVALTIVHTCNVRRDRKKLHVISPMSPFA